MNNAFFTFLKTRLTATVPAIKTVRMWNAQTDHNFQNPKDERPIALPACFVEFQALQTNNLSLGIKDVQILIKFRFALEHYTFERLSDLDFQDNFDYFIQTFRGNSTDTVQFSSLIEQETDLDEEFDNVNQPAISYTTWWRKLSGYTRKNDTTRNLTGVITYTKVNSLP